MSAYTPGPGDIMPPFAGHPHDQRTPEPDDDDADEYVIADVKYFVEFAERAAAKGEKSKARDALVRARDSLDEILAGAT